MPFKYIVNFLKSFPVRHHFYESHHHYLIKWLNIEFCSVCNLTCKWCSLDHHKERMMMAPSTLEKVFDGLRGNRKFRLERIDLHNAGEVLLHPDLEEMLKVVHSKKNYLSNRPVISLLTNATLLTEEKAQMIIRSEALDEIRFSVDGGTEELFESIRIGARWEDVRGNILKFVEMNRRAEEKIKTGIICIVPPERELDEKWMSEGFRFLLSKVDHVQLRYPHNWDGSKDLGLPRRDITAEGGRVCQALLGNLVVLPNGDTVVCCTDLNSRGVIGNITRNTLEGLYFSPKRRWMIKMFTENRKKEIVLCQNCDGFY